MEENCTQDILSKEIEKNRVDKIVAEAEIENAKNRFAQELPNEFDMKTLLNFGQPHKFKKPLGIRIKERLKNIVNKIITVFDGDE